MNKKWINVCIISGAVCLLSGCLKHYAPNPIKPLNNIADYKKTHDQVTIQAKELSFAECQEIFGDRTKRLFVKRKPFVPIQLTIENNSDNTWLLAESMIDLPIASSKSVISRLQNGRVLRTFATAGIALIAGFALCEVGGMFMIPLFLGQQTLGNLLLGLFGISLAAGGAVTVGGVPIFSVVSSGNTSHENRVIKDYVQKTSLGKALIIKPGETINVLLFVLQKQFKPKFTVTLFDQHDEQRTQTFNVTL